MKVLSGYLLEDLKKRTIANIKQAELFKSLSEDMLNWRKEEASWSILECLAHLNMYSDFYIPEITASIQTSPNAYGQYFKSGWLGDYFAQMMYPKTKLNKVKTPKAYNPLGRTLNKGTISKFISDQDEMMQALERAMEVDLNRTRTSIAILKFIKLRLGDTLRIVVYHNQRHVQQAQGVLETIKSIQKIAP